MDHDFSNWDAASPTALANAPITRRSGSLTPLSISTRRHSATPARAASSCWLNPVPRRAAFRLCPRRAPRLAGLLSGSTMSPAFESAKPGEWSGSRLACVWTATDHQGARWHGRWTRRRLVDHACHASKQIIDKPRKLWLASTAEPIELTSDGVPERLRAAYRLHLGAKREPGPAPLLGSHFVYPVR